MQWIGAQVVLQWRLKTLMFIRKVILALFWNTSIFGLLLFLSAARLNWWRAWVFLGVVFVATLVTMLAVFRDRPDLLRERSKGLIQKGQPVADRVAVLIFMVTFNCLIAFIPVDVFRLHLLRPPGPFVSAFGLLLFLAGWWIIALSFAANAFAIPVVKHQTERQHVVVDLGVYRFVRHPIYSGVVLLMIGMALWLQSYAAALLSIVPSAALVARIFVEENFLRRELAGYEEYTQRVRYRLVPYVW
jgi:protein-S-isoprenylcysteine O-methyltransferase Ste14